MKGHFNQIFLEKYLDDNRMVLTPNAKQDHRAMSIIDNFAKRIKTILTKTCLISNNKRWIDKLQNIIDI